MLLIKENKEKHRQTYLCKDCYRKVWYSSTPKWICDHVQLLNQLVPGYVTDSGNNWIEFNIICGTTAQTFEHTNEFIQLIYQFCLDNIKATAPYVHGDWTLSNIIISDTDEMVMCDWDNVGHYPNEEVMAKLHRDLTSAFGNDKFRKAINDTASI